MFNDPAFQPKGIDALSGLIKLMTSRRKLHLSWIEGGETSHQTKSKTFNLTFYRTMEKSLWATMLDNVCEKGQCLWSFEYPSIRLADWCRSTKLWRRWLLRDSYKRNIKSYTLFQDDDIDYGQNAEEIEDGRFLERRPKGDSLSVYLSLGSPAIFELDNEGIAFKLSDIYDLLESVKPSVIDRIVKALKVRNNASC